MNNEKINWNIENYGPYVELVNTGKYSIDFNSITIENWDLHFNSIINILKDSIETEYTANMKIHIRIDNKEISLSITDYLFNLIMTYFIIVTGDKIQGKHVFFPKNITKKSIKNYIDEFFIDVNRKKLSNVDINNIIDSGIHHFTIIDHFSFYLSNTVNLEDSIFLMNKSEEFYDTLHADLSNVPIEDVKNVGMDYVNKSIAIIKDSKHILGYDHCLANAFRSEDGINPKQFKEVAINIGSKPDGNGGAFSEIINTNFLTGGANNPLYYFIESSSGRIAQILSKMNIGYSGHFARLLGLNNMDTFLNPDPNYICDSVNFETVVINNDIELNKLDNRYYRLNPKGIEYNLSYKKDKHLIGQTIYLRSPMCCSSHSRGDGICYRCYGDLAYTNNNINIGRMAAEELSSKLTQLLLSAKHLLEAAIKKLSWKSEFNNIFEIETNIIKLLPDTNFRNWKLIIDVDNIILENEEDYVQDEDAESAQNTLYSEYINEFTIVDNNGESFSIGTEDYDAMYISTEFNNIIKNKAEIIDEKIYIDLNELKEIPIFYIIIQNNELSRTLDKLKYLLNNKAITKSYDRHSILQNIIDIVISGGIHVNSIHLEVILSNQIRDNNDILEVPDWSMDNPEYEILTLGQSLSNNRSISISLSYQDLSRTLYNPLTFRKRKSSCMDLFFMDKPQEFLNKDQIVATKKSKEIDEPIVPATIIDNKE